MKTLPKSIRRSVLLTSLAAFTGLLVVRPSYADEPSASTGTIENAITKPSMESKLAFAAPGLVVDVAVNDFDIVKKGQVLASQDTREDEFAYESMKLEADSDVKVNYSKADRDLKKTQLDRKEKMLLEHVASPSEVEEAKNAWNLATAQIDLAVLENNQKKLDAKKQAVKIEQMHRTAPYDGIIETVNIHPGEMADPQSKDGAIVIAQWDPLWVEMHLPTSQSAQLKQDQTLSTKFDGETDWKPAKVQLLGVDAASDTQLVRLVLANPGNAHHPGLHVQVKLPEKPVATAAVNP